MRYNLTILVLFVAFFVSGQSNFGSTSHSKPIVEAELYELTPTQARFRIGVVGNGGSVVTNEKIYFNAGFPPATIVNQSSNIRRTSLTDNILYDTPSLIPDTKYSAMFCATNSAGEFCTGPITFYTPALYNTPSVVTNNPTNITTTNATLNGNVTSDGGATVYSRGFILYYQGTPTQISSGSGTGYFDNTRTTLNPASAYTYRAYATNSVGTSYGDLKTFQTTTPNSVPILTTTLISSITNTSGNSGGVITSDGGSTVLTRGVCYSTSSNPTIASDKIASGTGIGEFTIILTPLSQNTLYYYRAYAVNAYGIAYGATYSFTTGQSSAAPTVLTTAITYITTTAVTGGGNVTNQGSSAITARGLVWSQTANPTTNSRLGQTSETGTTGTFVGYINNLTCANSYYVRAYATNIYGTSYGDNVLFTTSGILAVPTVTTSTVSGISSSGGYFSGVVNNTGCLILQEYGIEISTNSGMTGSDSYSCKGVFSRWITLSASTTYYYRAYAINSQGTGYGTIYSFTTLSTTSLSYINSRRDYFTGNPISINYTIPTGATLLIVSVHTKNGVKRTGSAPTYNGVAMIFAATDAYNEIYYLENPSVGYYTLAMGNTSNSNVGVTSTWFNHGSTSFTVYDTGNSTGTSINVTSAISTVSGKNAFIYNSDTFRDEGTFTPLNYTEYSHTNLGVGFIGEVFGNAAQYGWIAGTGSDVNMTYTLTGAKEWHSLSVCFTFN